MSATPHLDVATERRIEESLERRQRKLNRRERLGTLALRGRVRRCRARTRARLRARARAVPAPRRGLRGRLRPARTRSSSRPGRATPSPRSSCSCRCCCCSRRRSCRCSWSRPSSSRPPTTPCARGTAPSRGLVALADAWFAIAPAIVLVAFGAQLPAWAHWPAYAAALAAQLALDAAMFGARGRTVLGLLVSRDPLREMGLGQRVDVLLAPIGLLAAIAAADAAGWPRCSCSRWSPLLLGFEREREGADRAQPRARPRLPRHRAAPARPARGRRRVHRPPHRGRRRALGPRRRADGRRRGHAARDRAGRAAARHRQDRRARRDHQQARPAGRRRVGDHATAHRRGPADARPGRRPARERRPRRARLARALGRRRLPGRPRRRGDPASRPGSSPPATRTTR